MNNQIVQAIRNRQLLRINYHGGARIIEPYVYGVSTAGHEVLRAYQNSGMSTSKSAGWKMFLISSMQILTVLPETFTVHNEYNPKDKDMVKIYAAVSK